MSSAEFIMIEADSWPIGFIMAALVLSVLYASFKRKG